MRSRSDQRAKSGLRNSKAADALVGPKRTSKLFGHGPASHRPGFPKEGSSERHASLVFELTLMLLRGYIFQKSYPSAQLFGNLPVDGSIAAHAVHCVVESVACPMDPCADADS